MGAVEPGSAGPQHHGGVRMHVSVAIVLTVLTLGAFTLAGTRALTNWSLLGVLLVLAAAQITLQVLYYMHLKWDRRLYAAFFVGAVCLAGVIAVIGHILAGR